MRHDTRHRGRLRRPFLRGVAAIALSIAAFAGIASAQDYRVQPGDVIEMSVAGMPEMGARSSIQIDGSLSFPTVGVIQVAGLPISEIRERIRMSLFSKLLPVYLPDGTETTRTVQPDQISASVAEYRPVFVSGDVTQPGEYPFRPGMTARQAIAASGGVMTAVPVAIGYNPAGLRAEYAVAWHAAVAAAARVWRLRRELGEDLAFDRTAWPPAPEQNGALDGVLQVETEIFEMRAKNYRHEGEFLSEQLKQIDSQTEVLQRQLEVDKSVEQTDAEALAKANEASEKGILTQARLQDIRSGALFSATRRLQTEVNLMQLERRRTEISRETERRSEERRLGLLDELQQAWIVEGQERARLFGADEKLRTMGFAPVTPTQAPDIPEITIIRNGVEMIGPATYESRIEPGDVVQVRKPTDGSTLLARAAPDQK